MEPILLWVPYHIPSINTILGKHWVTRYEEKKNARRAWDSVSQSFLSEKKRWTETISLQEQSSLEMPSQKPLDSMTPKAQESNGPTANNSPEANKAQS